MHGTDTASVDAARLTPSLSRATDASAFNAVLNHPDVFPMISVPGDQPLDASGLVADPRNILLMGEGGGILFVQHEPCIYEFHTNFLPQYRGRYAIEFAKLARRWMFTQSDAVSLLTKVPAFNRAAAFAVRIVGFKREFTRKAAWPSKDGPVDLDYFALYYPDWLWLEKGLIDTGREFHAELDAEYKRHGREPHQHPDDDAHDVVVGAAYEMFRAGQIEKSVILYNRIAVFAGFHPVALISKDPVLLDIGEAVLMLQDNHIKVLKCR